jgi:hypothetical protein
VVDKDHVGFATVVSIFFPGWPRSADRRTKPESTASQLDVSDCLDDQLLRSQMDLTWCLAKLALKLKSDSGVRASSDVGRAVEAALEKAERYSRQTPKNGLALTHLNSLRQAIAGLGLDVQPPGAETSQERFGRAKGVTPCGY